MNTHKWNRSIKGMYSKIKFRHKPFKKDKLLAMKDFAFLRGQLCRYCGEALPIVGYGVDRIDNNKGYTKNNSVPCCSFCNKAKSNRTEIDFISHIDKIYKYLVKSRL